MRPWWERHPGRLEEELEGFADRGFKVQLDQAALAGGRVVVQGTYEVDGTVVDLKVSFPDDYPATRFAANANGLKLPRHQAPHGDLCLLGRGSDHWRREWLAADVIEEQLPKLAAMESLTEEALRELEDPQGEPYSAYYLYENTGAVLVPEDVADAMAGSSNGQITVQMLDEGHWPAALPGEGDAWGQGTVVKIVDEAGREARAPAELAARVAGPTWRGTWIRLDGPLDATLSDRDLITELRGHGAAIDFRAHRTGAFESALVALVFPEEARQGETADAWIFIVITRRKTQRTGSKGRRQPAASQDERQNVRLLRGLRTGPLAHGERIPEVAGLRDCSVVVIGLGSLGSPIARELAKAQLGDLIGIDSDFSDAGPVVRWDLGLGSVGPGKARALREQLARDYPFTRMNILDMEVGHTFGGRGAGGKDELELVLMTADLVIDATGEPNVREVIAEYAKEAGIPMISVWSFEGYGGVVMRIAPGAGACYYCFERWLSPDSGAIQLPSGPLDPQRVQPFNCSDRTFTATSPDLRPLADHAVRMAFGELTGGVGNGYPTYAADTYIYWHRNADGSLVDPPEWSAETMPRHDDCPCHADES